jgi:hypothetical protein
VRVGRIALTPQPDPASLDLSAPHGARQRGNTMANTVDMETCSNCLAEWPWSRLREHHDLGNICPDCYREAVAR